MQGPAQVRDKSAGEGAGGLTWGVALSPESCGEGGVGELLSGPPSDRWTLLCSRIPLSEIWVLPYPTADQPLLLLFCHSQPSLWLQLGPHPSRLCFNAISSRKPSLTAMEYGASCQPYMWPKPSSGQGRPTFPIPGSSGTAESLRTGTPIPPRLKGGTSWCAHSLFPSQGSRCSHPGCKAVRVPPVMGPILLG